MAIDQTVVAGEVARPLRRAVAGEVIAVGVQMHARGAELARAHGGILEMADADDEVVAAFDDVDELSRSSSTMWTSGYSARKPPMTRGSTNWPKVTGAFSRSVPRG